ncbi:hypothetical protein ABGV42_02085 [Paenibacillus pabuli]|uniref:hypothetical protein n=1 Tax=Paenibacillus pabuli TaxID=1472 RepID=UPI003242BF04
MTNIYAFPKNDRNEGRTEKMTNNNLYIYFDCREVNGITCGAAIYQREGSAVDLHKKFVSFDKVQGENNFHHSFKALIVGLQAYLEIANRYPNHNITLMNQNKQIFTWLEEGVNNPAYAELLDEVDELLARMDLSKLRSKVIEGKANRAKKLLMAIKEKAGDRPMNLSRIQERQTSVRRLKMG